MGNSSASATSEAGPSIPASVPEENSLRENWPPDAGKDTALLELLRQSLADGTRSPEAILNAVADTARILTSADGVALALRKEGAIVCRARSGQIAPEIGTPLNAESGISGECLRTATILVCDDAESDERVDPEVCRGLGIRSIVVVPLRGRAGISGILEAFASHPTAFQPEQINTLRALAEIVEEAHAREQGIRPASPFSVSSVVPAATDGPLEQSVPTAQWMRFLKERYWILAVAAAILLLAGVVIRLSWRQTGAEIEASEPKAQPHAVADHDSASMPQEQLKPTPALTVRTLDHKTTKNVVQNAAEIQPTDDVTQIVKPAKDEPAKQAQIGTQPGTEQPVDVRPPSIEIASSAPPADLVREASGPTAVPEFGADVSQGITEAKIIRRVDPHYPVDARVRGISGAVTLDAMVGKDGAVHKVSVVTGPGILANAAEAAVREWRYSPALLNGKPIETQQRITVVFRLP